VSEQDAIALAMAEMAVGDYAPIRSAYRMEISGWMLEYLLTDKAKITKFKNGMKKAMLTAFPEAFYQGYSDGGGGGREDVSKEDDAWLTAKMNAEMGYIDMLFQGLKDFRADPDTTPEDYQAEVDKRAENYCKTLDGIYSEGLLRGSKDEMVQFGGNDGMESCPECQKYQGVKHKISWWVRKGLVPGQPGNPRFSCHGYNCQHYLFSVKTGKIYTI
jgi:hypothetical protein